MTRREAMDILRRHRGDFDRFDVKSLALFGSTARDEAAPGSDVDILVEFNGWATFDNYMEVRILLEDILDAKVDLATPRMIRDPMRPAIDRDSLHVT